MGLNVEQATVREAPPAVPEGHEGAKADQALLQAEGVGYRIHGQPILRGVDVAVKSGEFLGIIGPNGAGKTTLMRVLAGIARPSEGQVTFAGRPLEQLSDRERARQIAFVSQNPGLGFGFTVRDVVSMGRYPYRRLWEGWRAEDQVAVEAAMAATGVLHLQHRPVTDLSGGERQRVFLARALAQQPRILFLDEPIANLDIRYQLEVLNLVSRLRERHGWTVVMAIHDLNWAIRYCDRLLVLQAGRLVACGPAQSVLNETLIETVFGVKSRIDREGERAVRVEFLSE